MKKIIALVLLSLLLPGLAGAAETLKPSNGTDWILYVFGNGYVVQQILIGVSLLMTGVGSSFITLMLFMAMVGFLSLALSAGFDPGKNMMKLVGYILTVWIVTYGSTRITANVYIKDLVPASSSTSANINAGEYRVEKVPALIALPAAVTSQVGTAFTRFIETYFTAVDSPAFTVSGSGQFNLFARMVQETDQYIINQPELKKSLSAYTANCVVPAIAMGQLRGPTGVDGQEVTGLRALMQSSSFLDVLASASHKAILTQYYPVPAPGQATEFMGGGLGTLYVCEDAYQLIKKDIATYAADMLARGTETWAKAGISVPFEEAMSTILAKAAAPGSESSGFSRPSGFIMQQAFLNASTGSFREAASQTGNNELMQAAALSQAEVQQKSAWVAGFHVFNNMMGYVFTVLQAFIFAITPIIVIAMLIPGMGKGIVVNYLQILIWLTLWSPMLAVINFIITLFASQQFAESISNGLNHDTKIIMSERANDLVVAAQFLGTMVPLMTWGIVKGAMAFTEFISHGIGSSFASQAGAAAATGNMSLNNMSMDNTSMNKYNTQSSSAVGTQQIETGGNAGAQLSRQSGGGATADSNAGGITTQMTHQKATQAQISQAEKVSKGAQALLGETQSIGNLLDHARDKSDSTGKREAATEALSRAYSASNKVDMNTARQFVSQHVSDTGSAAQLSQAIKVGLSGGAKDSGSALGAVSGGVSGGADMGRSNSQTESSKFGDSSSIGRSTAVGAGYSDSAGRASGFNAEVNHTSGTGSLTKAGMSESAAITKALQETYAVSEEVTRTGSLTETASVTQTSTGASSLSDFDKASASIAGGPTQASIEAKEASLKSGYSTVKQENESAVSGTKNRVDAAYKGMGHGPRPKDSTGAAAALSSITGEVDTKTKVVDKMVSRHGNNVSEQINDQAPAFAKSK